VYIGPDSTFESRNNIYKNARSNVGGCITILGASEATFIGDEFSKCVGINGGAIAAIDFGNLTVDSC
jgi:hypothetical protein